MTTLIHLFLTTLLALAASLGNASTLTIDQERAQLNEINLAQYAAYDYVSGESGSIISSDNVSLTTFNALGGEMALQNKTLLKQSFENTLFTI